MSNASRADERQDFSDIDLVPMIFDSYQRYKIDGHQIGLDIILRMAPHDASPSFEKILLRWGRDAQMTFNIPIVFSNEFVLALQLMETKLGLENDVLAGYQEALGVKFRKLILMPDEDEGEGEVVGYIHSMNQLGEGYYFKVSPESGLLFALTHQNVPIYANAELFHTEHIRKSKKETAILLNRFGLSSSMNWFERVKKAILSDIAPNEFELLGSKAVLASELDNKDLIHLRDLAIQDEKYEWAHFITNILE